MKFDNTHVTIDLDIISRNFRAIRAVDTTLMISPARIWKLPLGIWTWPSRSMAQIRILFTISEEIRLLRSQSIMPSNIFSEGILKVTICA